MKHDSRQKAGPEFIVKHFAGDVTYQVSALVDKNKVFLYYGYLDIILQKVNL